MEKKTVHWRTLMDMKYLRAEMFQPKERKVLTIKEVKSEEVKSKEGKDVRPVLYFEEDILPMVLNVANCKMIESLYTWDTLQWPGKKIQVFATNVKVAGELTPCIRIENIVPKTEEVQYFCSVCGQVISKSTYDKSVAKYGKPYCSKECLEKGTQTGEEPII